jgi:hypothetical protein
MWYEGFPYSNSGSKPQYALLSASGSYVFTTLGDHNITAQYSGDPTTISGPSATINPALLNSPTVLSVLVNAPGYGGVLTGTVTFMDGGTALSGAVNVTSEPGYLIAWLNYTFTTPGVHNISVVYGGDNDYAASQSQVFPTTIVGPLALSLNSSTATLGSAGGIGTVSLSVTNNTSSAATVALTCTPSPTAAACSLSSSQVGVPLLGQTPSP